MELVSIILPVYNGIEYLNYSVSSVLQQSFFDFEFLILDDSSTDGSWEYLLSIKDDRIKLFKNEFNKGLFFNLNYLIQKSRGNIIKLWSQDDVMTEHCIEEILNFHKQNPEIGFSYSAVSYIDKCGTNIPVNKTDETPPVISKSLHTKIAFFTGSVAGNIANVALTKKALDKVGLFNEQMKISGDFDMWVRIAQYFPIGFINRPLILLRNHLGQLSKQESFYIYHLKEDISVYKYLLSYITKQEKEEGKRILRNNKLLFYYTLMVKALMVGKLKTAFKFLKTLKAFDNITLLTWLFFKNRVIFKKQHTRSHTHNKWLVNS